MLEKDIKDLDAGVELLTYRRNKVKMICIFYLVLDACLVAIFGFSNLMFNYPTYFIILNATLIIVLAFLTMILFIKVVFYDILIKINSSFGGVDGSKK